MRGYEKTLKKIMSRSGLIPYRVEDMEEVIARASCFIGPDLTGEAVLTVGASLSEVLKALLRRHRHRTLRLYAEPGGGVDIDQGNGP